MSSVHVIRLRGPWHFRTAAADAADGKVALPVTRVAGLGKTIAGHVSFQRAFNRPTNLAEQRISLVLAPAAPVTGAWLNGESLTLAAKNDSAELRWPIDELLADCNELRLEQQLPAEFAADAPLIGEVWLEIEES